MTEYGDKKKYFYSLARILKHAGLDEDHQPKDPETWNVFLNSVDTLFNDLEQERYLLERSMELSSYEFREIMDKFEQAEQVAKIGHWEYNPEKKELYWSREMYKILEFNPNLGTPKYTSILKKIQKNQRKNFNALIKKSLTEKEIIEDTFQVNIQDSNKTKWIYLKIHPTAIANGNTDTKIKCLGTLMDITEQKMTEEKINELNKKLIMSSRLAGMSEVATSVLHNLGNVLNSLNVSVSLIEEMISDNNADSLNQISIFIKTNLQNDNHFFINDEKGKLIPQYLSSLSEKLKLSNEYIYDEIKNLNLHIKHMKDIVDMQSDLSGHLGIKEIINIQNICETAIKIVFGDINDTPYLIKKNLDKDLMVKIDQTSLLQILVNLLSNAKDAINSTHLSTEKFILISAQENNTNHGIEISIEDNGIGIKQENLVNIFAMGFTTKNKGHGFGLHNSANIAKILGGDLVAESKGENCGALFTITIPNCLKEIYDET